MKTDINGQSLELIDKMFAHKQHILHKAFSVFIIDENEQMLVQKRAINKYHSGGLLTNACCSHPVTEDIKKEAKLRLVEELGISCEIEFVDKFLYYAEFENSMAEFELDYIFIGKYNSDIEIKFNKEEISKVEWIPITKLCEDVSNNPSKYTRWFVTALYNVLRYLNSNG